MALKDIGLETGSHLVNRETSTVLGVKTNRFCERLQVRRV